MKQIATIIALTLVSSMAQAQSCIELCNVEWWKSATQAEIEAKIATADVDARNEDSRKALFWAVRFEPPNAVDALLNADADVSAWDAIGYTALFSAKTSEAVEALLAAGANVDARDENGWTALILAAKYGTPEVVDALLAAGADGSASNIDGQTAFDLAQANGRLKGTDAYWRLNDTRFK